MACEIMLQRGKTLANMLSARLETAADAIIVRHYTRGADFPKSQCCAPRAELQLARIADACRMATLSVSCGACEEQT
jgi:hypothetical protein